MNALPKISPLASAAVTFATSGDHFVVAGVANKTIQIYKLVLVATGATAITIKDDQTALSGAMSLAANGELVLMFDGTPHFESGSANGFNINSSLAVQVSGTVWYTQQ